jgi:predicted ATPase
MPICDLRVTNVGPFDDITFEFDAHINVFVGPNSSGKSTALMALADIAAYPFVLPSSLTVPLDSMIRPCAGFCSR